MPEQVKSIIRRKLTDRLPVKKIRHETSQRMATSIHRIMRQLVSAELKSHRTRYGSLAYMETAPTNNQQTLLFLHGFADSKESFFSSMLYLYKRYHIVAPDLPGFGLSFKSQSFGHTLDDYAKVLASFVKAKKLKQIHLVGNSLGGAIAARLATLIPKMIRSTTLIDSAGIILKDHQSFYHDYFKGKNLFAISNREQFDYLLQRVFHRKMLVPWPIKEHLYHQFIANHEWYKLILEKLTEGITSLDDPQINDKSLNHKIGEIRSPTLILWGRQDSFFPPQTAHYIKEKLPHAILEILEATGHSPQIERPGAFAKSFNRFASGT